MTDEPHNILPPMSVPTMREALHNCLVSLGAVAPPGDTVAQLVLVQARLALLQTDESHADKMLRVAKAILFAINCSAGLGWHELSYGELSFYLDLAEAGITELEKKP